MVTRLLRLSVSARLNLAGFCSCRGLSGVLAFGLVDALLAPMSYAFTAFIHKNISVKSLDMQRRGRIATAPLACDAEATGCARSTGARLALLATSDGQFAVSLFSSSSSSFPKIVNTF